MEKVLYSENAEFLISLISIDWEFEDHLLVLCPMFYSYSAIYAREYATVQYKYSFAGLSWSPPH